MLLPALQRLQPKGRAESLLLPGLEECSQPVLWPAPPAASASLKPGGLAELVLPCQGSLAGLGAAAFLDVGNLGLMSGTIETSCNVAVLVFSRNGKTNGFSETERSVFLTTNYKNNNKSFATQL